MTKLLTGKNILRAFPFVPIAIYMGRHPRAGFLLRLIGPRFYWD